MENQEKINVISINGVDYIPATQAKAMAFNVEGKPYQIVRTYSSGVFAGYIEKRDGQEVVMKKARRLWYWDGAASLSQLAIDGPQKPENCKFPEEVETVTLMQVIEILDCTAKAEAAIKAVTIWKQ